MKPITPDELARLRVPLSELPGLDPVGLTILAMWGNKVDVHAPCVMRPEPGSRMLAVCEVEGDWTRISTDTALVTLEHASTADRVARWVAGRVGLKVGCTAPAWERVAAFREAYRAWIVMGDYTATGCRSYGFRAVVEERVYTEAGPVSGLDALDPTDDRRLPDGSRYVDRLALALVAVDVGGAPA